MLTYIILHCFQVIADYWLNLRFRQVVRLFNTLVRGESVNQSINIFITRHGTEARATVRIMPKRREMS